MAETGTYEVRIRPAKTEDAALIARDVLDAVGRKPSDEGYAALLECMTGICAREDTLYSWRNSIVAEAVFKKTSPAAGACESGGSAKNAGDRPHCIPVGTMTSYDGADYAGKRRLTFGLAGGAFPPVPAGSSEPETCAGEYYLDSLAVLPEFRGHGIAKLLIKAATETARAKGFTRITLIALASDSGLQALYASCGFKPEGHLNFLGHDYLKMVLSDATNPDSP